ncbi:MAG: OmpA family protein, partial [Luteolibacter sp.]
LQYFVSIARGVPRGGLSGVFGYCQLDSLVYYMGMENEARWSDMHDNAGYRLPGPEHIGRWAVVAMLVSILLHVLVFFALDKMKIAMGIIETQELSTDQMNVQQVEVRPYEPEAALLPEETVTPPDDSASLIEEVDLLELLPEDTEIDMVPSVLDPEFALKMSNPLAEGELDASEIEVSASFDMESDLPEMGRLETELQPAALGQLTVDPGAVIEDDGEMADFTDDLVKLGNKGDVENGKLDGIKSLDEMLDLPPNLLLSKKTLLPSDLIFEFNSANLRESAKIGLMKLALLIDKNPNLYCWIEGHTDLVGGEEFNVKLSLQRAESVKSYLVDSLGMESEQDRIITRGYGKSQPLVADGDGDAQAPNRRVEIRMRKTPPESAQLVVTPQVPKAKPLAVPKVEPKPEPEPPKAILVKPNIQPKEEPAAPRATVVPDPEIRRAQPVQVVPRALPVDP